MDDLMKKLHESAEYISGRIDGRKVEIAMVLGSGLGELGEKIENPVFIDYRDIPHFPVSTVPGHKGRLVVGELEGKGVMCMQGRFHFYEGWSMDECVYPIRTMFIMGIKSLLLTNAAGCINTSWKPGDLMLITDHIKLIPESPNRGPNHDELGPRFFDMCNAYDKDLMVTARKAAEKKGIGLREGVVIAASQMRMHVLGLSCMTNMAAGILDQSLNHEEVIETGNRVKGTFESLVREIVRTWPEEKI